ncbi:MAG TPA: glycosyl hydrolase [Thermoanaerobaculia bacterium]|nr:glycosyl hydrolase [Thermoanaerobaculia bacterium]
MRWKTDLPLLLLAGLTLAGLAAGPAAAQTAPGPVEIDSNTFGGLEARAIGPAVMSGRIAAIDAVAEDPVTIYAGSAGGGLWKSRDAGVTWKAVFDAYNPSIGAVTVDRKNPKTVWVGTGESWTRNSVSVGDGVYKSTDAGETWQAVGLADSERIARIRVHPQNGDTVWVCATGHLWNSNEERGVFKTTDGGKTWKKVLYVDADTGCSDIDVDPQDPTILYAGMWQFRRTPYSFNSGGKGSGLYMSNDGGENWRLIRNGLPEGEKGRIAVAVAPSRPSVVYALVESESTALYRSDDVGKSWARVNGSSNVQVRPFYFAQIVVDPTDFNRVYKPGLSLTSSVDGGKSFSDGGFGASVHSDHHALWVNPRNPHHLLLGTDGGVYVSYDRGNKWQLFKALPVSQFYRISYDMERPYNVYGGLQDNGSWQGPSRGLGGIFNRDWRNIGIGDGFYAFRDPNDPDLVYVEYQGGRIGRTRLSTGENKTLRPLPGKGDPKFRFNWNTPVHLSPTQPGTIYLGSQFLFRSRDQGESWEKISPDLTTNDPAKQRQAESGGLTIDNSSAENHTTIYAISESPRNGQVIWAGTDDGNLQVTRDGGARWTNVAGNVEGLPKGTWVSGVEASHHAEGTAYATFDGHATGDMKTYVYKTTDFGQTWKPLATAALAGYAHVVREDLVNPDLLFLGTESGLFISVDGGGNWARFTGNFPRVAVRDLAIHPRESDLIVATHGRGVYILDDITPLRHLTRALLDQEAALLPGRDSALVLPVAIQDFPGDDEFAGANPPEAATIFYYLKKRHLVGDFKLELLNAKGEVIANLQSAKRRGINRAQWPMRLKPPKLPASNTLAGSLFTLLGPRVPAGAYTVRLTRGSEVQTSQIRLVPDPRSRYSDEDRAVQYQTAMALYGHLERLTYIAGAAAEMRDEARKRAGDLPKGDRLRGELEALADRLDGFRRDLVASGDGGRMAGEERLREEIGDLYGAVNGYEGKPTRSQLDHVAVLSGRLDEAVGRFEGLRDRDVAAVNRSLAKRKLAPIPVLSREEWEKKQEKG